ncbi:MAG: HNH endonuclease [Clostridia bacterium]|nr:HNH endonuclease [Clostridia bacterium]
MKINRKRAMAIWEKRYGPEERATDFAGREMERDAYNDRNSELSWNMDHVLPKSKGGKATESNLVCCNMRTNDEKAASFPVFRTNGIRFQVLMKHGHCEIQECRMALGDGGKTVWNGI